MGSSMGPTKLSRYHLLESISSKTFTPREYQVELLDCAKKRNTIICLGTGAGKTFIAVMLIKELAYQTREFSENDGKKTIFLVPTGPLVHQQAKVIEDYTDLSVGKLYGCDVESSASLNVWINEIQRNHVIISTPDIIKLIILHGFLALAQINLMIFDECHRAVRNDAYSQIMQCFDICPIENQPRILGLSASLVNCKCKPARLEQEIRNLERTLLCSVETSSELTMLSKYGSKPEEFLIQYEDCSSDSDEFLGVLSIINSALVFMDDLNLHWQLDEFSHPCKKPRSYLVELSHVVMTLGPWCTMQATKLFLHEVYPMLDLMYSDEHRNFLLILTTVLHKVQESCYRILKNKPILSKLLACTPPKLEELLKLLKRYKPIASTPPETNSEQSTQIALTETTCKEQSTHAASTSKTNSKQLENSGSTSETPSGLSVNIDAFSEISNKQLTQIASNPESSQVQLTQFALNSELNQEQSATIVSLPESSKGQPANETSTLCIDVPQNKSNRTEIQHKVAIRPTTTSLRNSRNKKRTFTDYQRFEDTKGLCGVVFVRQRITAYVLNLWISEISKHDEDFKFLSTNFIIGHGRISEKGKVLALESHKQEEVLRKFKTREHNLLVTTSVVEEGLDIPKCNLVVRFDLPESFRSYVQSKGRARATDSLFVIMVGTSEKEKFLNDLCDYKMIEEMLLQRSHRMDSMEDETKDQNVDNVIEPYMPVKEDGAPRVTLSSAISLVNRYCAKLPSDTFTRLTPKWKIKCIGSEDCNMQFECTIKLPINSPLKQSIVGQHMKSKHLAKMATALETCKKLHQMGELDDNLLPTGKEAVKFEEDFSDECPENPEVYSPRPGTTKRRQYYFKQVADAFKNGVPKPGMPCFLYVFHMMLTCPIPEEQNTRGRKIHDPSDSPRSFGMVLRNPLPKICSFPVFTRSGEVSVSIECVMSNLILDEEQLDQLSFCHNYTFSQVLRLEKYPMTYCPSKSEFSCFVVPVNMHSIDWDFVHHINKQRGVEPRRLSEKDRRFFTFTKEDYIDAVVMPWYRNLDKPQFFYVAEICSSLSPLSSFPDECYGTFKGYYENKYSITIMNSTQPLLDVDHTSARLNLLTPRYVNRKGVTLPTSSENTKKTKREDLEQKQILIPELCIIHPFPASLWRKAVCLPCILYRTNSLLLAEQVRSTVAEDITVGTKTLSVEFSWPMLDFGWTLADVVKAHVDLEENVKESKKKDVSKKYMEKKYVENGCYPLDGHKDFSTNSDIQCNDSYPNENDHCNADFEIDMFDPSKLVIPDDNDYDQIEQELMDFNVDFGNFESPALTFPAWESAKEPVIMPVRYGSPSNFENAGWDFEWNTNTEDGNFFSLNESGLGYISAPGIFDMQSLSRDLALQKNEEDELYDSWDEESSLDSSLPCSTKCDASNRSYSIQDPQEKETIGVAESDWLTNGSSNATEPISDLQDPAVVETAVVEVVDSLHDTKMNEIKFLNSLPPVDHPNVLSSFPKIFSVVEQTDTYESIYNEVKIPDADCDMKNDYLGVTKAFEEEVCNTSGDSTLPFGELLPNRDEHNELTCDKFTVSFDDCPDLNNHCGPSPSIILQAFTMSNANDGINLERLETVGDSFLKYAITVYLFCMYPNIHEGKLSFLRSKQISNLNLYRLGKVKHLGELMVATKFEPNDNWLPPCYIIPKGLEQALIESGLPISQWNISNFSNLTNMSEEEIFQSLSERRADERNSSLLIEKLGPDALPLIPYNLLTQHSIPDKSIADCVEALIGAYLVSCGSRGALLFMSWLGLRVLPKLDKSKGDCKQTYGQLQPPPSPLLSHVPNSDLKLSKLLSGYSSFEDRIGYVFKDKSYLLQAFTHASYYYNTLTDCYQRLEFLGDAVLDYLITRHLYEDPKKHSPGTLTDLRSALVNNTFFASLAVKYDFHKYFKAISPSLFSVINRFVELKEHSSFEDYSQSYYLEEEECEEVEEVEVPKALGDIFESVAGALYLDSGMSLDTVWRVYYSMMKPEIDYFSTHVPKSPIRELLELEPQTAKFEKSEMTLNGKVRVRVEVFGKGSFVGIGRNKRIAKCTAAKRALRELKRLRKLQESKKA